MRASNILSDQIPPLLHSDTGEKALFWMDEFQVNHLPVLKNGNFVGLVSESELLDQSDLNQSLVLDRQENYLGVISAQELLQLLAESSGLNGSGSVLVLEMNANDYTLAQIAQIVESNHAKILNLFVSNIPDSTKIQVNLRINQQNLSAIFRTFERYDYQVLASFQDSQQPDELQDRYQELMHYLSM